jgi:hypothetical protein
MSRNIILVITYLFLKFLMVQMDLLNALSHNIAVYNNISIMLSKISYKQKQITSHHHIIEIYPDQVNLTVLGDAYSVYISHMSQWECTSSALLHMHPFPGECCSQNGCRAQVPVLKAARFSFLQEQNI